MPTVLGTKEGSIGFNRSLVVNDNILTIDRRFELIYLVLSDNTSQGVDDILATSGIPPLYYPTGGAFCTNLDPKEVATVHNPMTGVLCNLWEVTISFDSASVVANDDSDLPPEAKRPSISWSGDTEEELMVFDRLTGQLVRTDANEAMLTTCPMTIPILEITRYEFAPFDPLVMIAYANRTNSTTFWGAPRGTAWMLPMSSEEEVIDGVRYVSVTYRIKFKLFADPKLESITIEGLVPLDVNSDTWDAIMVHEGYMYRPALDKPPQTALDKHGSPVKINLADGGVRQPLAAQFPDLKRWARMRKAEFNNLSLGPF